MPIYEYKCKSCGQQFEVRQSFSDQPLKEHEGCGGAVERLLSAPALQFKGSGWYVTDYAKTGSSKPAAGNGSGNAAKTETKSSDSGSSSGTSSTSSSSSSTSSSDKK